jgi:hypothetical protein
MTTSYFSSVPLDSNLGVSRGTGGANDGRTRRSRDEVEYSVKTGIFAARLVKDVNEMIEEHSRGKKESSIVSSHGIRHGNSFNFNISIPFRPMYTQNAFWIQKRIVQ